MTSTAEPTPQAHSPLESVRKLAFIDALRGVAVIGVLFTHCIQISFDYGRQITDPFNRFLYNFFYSGMYGVQLFFVVSAFTMLHSFYGRLGEPNAARNFFIRRFFRIAPMFYLGIIAYIPVHYFAMGQLYDWWGYLLTFFFVHGFSMKHINTIVPGGWSISVEFMFYLLVPSLAKVIRNLQNAIVFTFLMLILSLSSYALAIHQKWSLLEWEFAFYWMPNQLVVFGCGFILFFLCRERLATAAASWEKWGWWASFLALIGVAGWHPGGVPGHLPFAALFVVWAFFTCTYRPKIIVNRFFERVGVLSFSVYIWHYMFVMFYSRVMKKFGVEDLSFGFFILLFSLVLGTSWILADLSWKFLEKPGQDIGKKLIKKLTNRNALAA